MKKNFLFALWGGMFILCAGLGFIPEPEGTLAFLLTAVSVLFFLPPALLLYRAIRDRDSAAVLLIRNLSILSLSLTLVLIIANFLSPLVPEFWGTVLHCMLVILSSPMICSGHWALSLFLWACLLMGSRTGLQGKP